MNQITRSPSYLIRNPHSYCFRMAVPKDVQPYIGKRELRYSLRTGYLSTAKSKARLMAGRVQQLFQELRRNQHRFMNLTDQQIKEMVIKYLEQSKASMDEPFGPNDGKRPFDDEASLAGYIRDLDDVETDLQVELTTGDYWRVRDSAITLLKESGVSTDDIDEGSVSFAKLCEGLLRAELKGLDYHRDRLKGTAIGDLETALNSVLGKGPAQPPVAQVQTTPGIPLSDLIARYSDENKRAENWSDRTEIEYTSIFRNIQRLFGDVSLDRITMESARKLKAVLLKLPSSYFKATTKFKSVSPAQAAQENDGKTLSVKTVNKYLDNIKALFRFAVQHGYMEQNYADGLKIPIKNKANKERLPFDNEELITLFHSTGYKDDTFKPAWKFWLPILGLFTGCRLEELCQLRVDDVQQVDDIWILSIVPDEEAEQRVKRPASVRLVPLPPFIVEELRFPAYVQRVIDEGHKRLWPELKKQSYRWGHYPSRWFGDLIRKLGIKHKKKVFHSFRHNIQNSLKRGMVQPHLIDELVGHAHQGETLGRYTQEFPVNILYREGTLKLDYGIDLSHLKASKWVPKD